MCIRYAAFCQFSLLTPESRFTVNLSSIGIDAGNGTHRQYSLKDTNVHLDSGHTFSKLQKDLAEKIFQDLGAELDEDLGFYLVDCKVRDHEGGITFGFGGDKIITVPFREFVYTAQGLCAVGLEPIKEGEQQVLGDSFLRAAYGELMSPLQCIVCSLN